MIEVAAISHNDRIFNSLSTEYWDKTAAILLWLRLGPEALVLVVMSARSIV